MWQAPNTIIKMLKRNVSDFPNRDAFASVSYRTGDWVHHRWKEMDEISDRLAAGLADLGVEKGQKVAFMLTNSAECYYTYLAIDKLGAIFVPINVRLVPREIEYIVENSDADYIIGGNDFLPQLDKIRDQLNVKSYVGIEKDGKNLPDWATSYSKLFETSSFLPKVTVRPDDTADIL